MVTVIMMGSLRLLVFLLGLLLIYITMRSALITFVLPRSAPEKISRTWFRLLRRFFDLRLHWTKEYLARDRIMAIYAPLTLLSLLPIWLLFVTLGFACLYWATGMNSQLEDLVLSGSSLLTLGFARGDYLIHDLFAFVEATLGLILVAVLIAYLPTMYSAFSRRESAVSRLAVRAGTPPSAIEFILRAQRIIGFPASPFFPDEPISITRTEFDELCEILRDKGVPLKEDLEQAWLDFGGWRVNYDRVLLALATLTMAPDAHWSTDRAPAYRPLPLFK